MVMDGYDAGGRCTSTKLGRNSKPSGEFYQTCGNAGILVESFRKKVGFPPKSSIKK